MARERVNRGIAKALPQPPEAWENMSVKLEHHAEGVIVPVQAHAGAACGDL
ncbi:MAG: hypothetical protein ACREJM_02705 [Candidatus Saccharimonadales bacterium]